jgi:putative transcriptional regulator
VSLRGQLLIASPSLFDPNFRRTVILIAHHDENGAVGVVLNRRSEMPAADAIPALSDLVGSDAAVWLGGPVEPSSVLVVAELEEPDQAAALVFGNVGFLDLDTDSGDLPRPRRVRIFAGYAGWAAEQLEAELASASWLQEPATSDDVFSDGDLFEEVLLRKGGFFRMLARMPLDPSLN